jgi:micrococcal nuclease
MGKVLPFRRQRRWTRARDYGAREAGWLAAARETGPILWAAPLAVAVAVFMFGHAPFASDPAGGPSPRMAGPLPAAHTAAQWDRAPALSKAQMHDLRNGPAAVEAQQPNLSAPAFATGAGRGGDREAARFTSCDGGGRQACVVDGDTFWYRGQKIRIADINTPETGNPQCTAEAELGARAAARLTQLLNAGAFSLESTDRTHDRYGRALFTVTRDGESVGTALVREGLAEEWRGYRQEWC